MQTAFELVKLHSMRQCNDEFMIAQAGQRTMTREAERWRARERGTERKSKTNEACNHLAFIFLHMFPAALFV